MKPVIRTPYFEVGTKNYVYGDKLLEYARAADAAAEKYDIDVLFICPARHRLYSVVAFVHRHRLVCHARDRRL